MSIDFIILCILKEIIERQVIENINSIFDLLIIVFRSFCFPLLYHPKFRRRSNNLKLVESILLLFLSSGFPTNTRILRNVKTPRDYFTKGKEREKEEYKKRPIGDRGKGRR